MADKGVWRFSEQFPPATMLAPEGGSGDAQGAAQPSPEGRARFSSHESHRQGFGAWEESPSARVIGL
ncbi:hypothetical protein M419DRAFT_11530 [Trichoderma reesei RUT C-30]|uniref:Uncharacterized protein n=1 Tax=Hypocrea jecorina (strain ATCC 56765 / BCRC 32924 / NRRL 11460 / Rut C-30) TaxID=1344414 RepID=A0A024S0A1_HYPJR|nr:hypothetical protein M419DRAFT_11530 [Trichoderma reesei RUT C-30]